MSSNLGDASFKGMAKAGILGAESKANGGKKNADTKNVQTTKPAQTAPTASTQSPKAATSTTTNLLQSGGTRVPRGDVYPQHSVSI